MILSADEQQFPTVATRHDVVNRPAILESQRPCHALELPSTPPEVKCVFVYKDPNGANLTGFWDG